MSKERAKRRAEREQVAAHQRELRAKKRERRERASAAGRKVTTPFTAAADLVKTALVGRGSAEPILARRARRRAWMLLGSALALQIILWPIVPGWPGHLLTLLITLMALPLIWVVLFG